MSVNKEEYYSLKDIQYFLKSFLRYVAGKWVLLFIAALGGAALGFFYFKYMQKPKYQAVCTFILEEKESGLGGLGGIASQFGLDMGGLSGGGSIFAGDNILEILKSRNIIQKVLLSKVDNNPAGEQKTLADLFLEFTGWKERWASKDDVSSIQFSGYKNGEDLSLKQDSILSLIHEYLLKNSLTTERLNKKGSIIKVTFTASDQLFAKLMSDRVIDESRAFYITIKTNTAQQNVNRLERQSDSLLALLNNKSYEAAGALVLDANPALRSLNVPSELKMRDKAVLGTIYSEVVKNLELSRMSLNQQTPVIQILDRPSFPLADKKKSVSFLIFSFVFAAVSFTFLVLVVWFIAIPAARPVKRT